jgi:hypothetical protein
MVDETMKRRSRDSLAVKIFTAPVDSQLISISVAHFWPATANTFRQRSRGKEPTELQQEAQPKTDRQHPAPRRQEIELCLKISPYAHQQLLL